VENKLRRANIRRGQECRRCSCLERSALQAFSLLRRYPLEAKIRSSVVCLLEPRQSSLPHLHAVRNACQRSRFLAVLPKRQREFALLDEDLPRLWNAYVMSCDASQTGDACLLQHHDDRKYARRKLIGSSRLNVTPCCNQLGRRSSDFRALYLGVCERRGHFAFVPISAGRDRPEPIAWNFSPTKIEGHPFQADSYHHPRRLCHPSLSCPSTT